MVGILLISHGNLAPGLKDSLTMFFGSELKQFETLSLKMDDAASEFGERIKEKIEEVDSGDGVIVFADVLGGTPFNQAAQLLNDDIELIVGMNLPMLMEVLGTREYNDIDVDELVEKGKNSIINAKAMLMGSAEAEEDDD